MRTVPMLWAVLMLSGCAVGPVFAPPRIDLPDRYALIAPVSAPRAEDVRWWENFNDPVLNRLVDETLAGNLDLAEAQARLREAEALERRDGVLISGDGEINASAASRDAAEQANAEITANIGLAGEQRQRARGAAQRRAAAQLDELEARRSVLAELTIAYVDLRFAQRSLELLNQDLASRQRTLGDINTLLEAGETTQLDVLRAESLVTETRSQVPNLVASVVRQRNRISTLMGRPVGMIGVDLGYAGAQPDPHLTASPGVPADLLRARNDIRRAERLYAAAVSDLGAAEAARYPSLRLRGSILAPLHGGSSTESLLAGLTMPIFNQPALAASADAAKARVDQTYLQWRQSVLRAVEEVENAQANLQASIRTTREAQRLLDLNRRSLDLSRELLSSRGAITVLDVLDRERAVSDARALHARSLRDQAADFVSLRTALGQGHPFEIE